LAADLRPRAATAAEVSRCIEKCPFDRVAVEEQDSSFYIIHISNEPEIIWFSVNSQSPIFEQLRQRHSRWMTEHPGWNGWVVF
jgi:hypothetical protein